MKKSFDISALKADADTMQLNIGWYCTTENMLYFTLCDKMYALDFEAEELHRISGTVLPRYTPYTSAGGLFFLSDGEDTSSVRYGIEISAADKEIKMYSMKLLPSA